MTHRTGLFHLWHIICRDCNWMILEDDFKNWVTSSETCQKYGSQRLYFNLKLQMTTELAC